MGKTFWEWLDSPEEYEQETQIYADKDKYVFRQYINTKKGTRRDLIEGNNKTNQVTFKSTNQLMNAVGKLIELKINQKLKEKELENKKLIEIKR